MRPNHAGMGCGAFKAPEQDTVCHRASFVPPPSCCTLARFATAPPARSVGSLLAMQLSCTLAPFADCLPSSCSLMHVSSRQPRPSMLACLFKHLQTPALNAGALPLGATAWKPPAAVEPGTLLPPAAACTGWRRLLRFGPATLLALHLGSGQRLELAASSIQRPARLCPCAMGVCLSVSLQRRCALTRWDLQARGTVLEGAAGECNCTSHSLSPACTCRQWRRPETPESLPAARV